jgi:hypothetical protein
VVPTRDLPAPRPEDRLDGDPPAPRPEDRLDGDRRPPVGPAVDLPAPAHDPRPWTPHGPSTPHGPPPPPAAAVRSDGPARNTAATVVAATGALLLLAAAVTFLAVSWDQLGLTARVAAVGSGTAAAIVGGARLRRSLPAVGAVVFHLGALLLPVDALGLALQLDASLAATWTAVGVVTLTTLPVAAHVGRSRVLAVAALTGVPILATGIGLAGGPPAPLLTAVGAVAALALVRIRHPRTSGDDQGASGDDQGASGDDQGASGEDEAGLAAVLPWAAPATAVAAVVGPLLVAVASELAIATRGAPLQLAADAGWLPTTWSAAATSGAVAVAVVAAAAVLRRSVVLAGAVPILVALAAVGLLLPGDAPRLAQLLPWPLLFLAVEAAAVAVRRDRALAGAGRAAATVTELLAALALPAALGVVATATRDLVGLLGFGSADVRPDTTLAAVALLTAVAWAVAAVRRSDHLDDGSRGGRAVGGLRSAGASAVAVAGAVTLAAAVALVWPASGLAVLVLLLTVVAAATVPAGGAAGVVASATVLVVGATSVVGTWAVLSPWTALVGPADVLVAVVAAVVAVACVERTERHATVGESPAALLLLPAALLAAAVAATSVLDHGHAVALLVLGALLVGPAARLRHLAVGADLLRVLGGAVVLLLPDAGIGLAAATTAAAAAALVGVVLAVEGLRLDRRHLLVLAGPVLVRAVAGAVHGVSGSPVWTGGALLVVALLAVVVAVARPGDRVAGVVTAVAAGVPAVALLSLTPTALAWGTVVVGATVVAGGLAARRADVAHAGGLVTTLGVWQLLALAEVTAVDAWLAGPALQLWLFGAAGRRAGRLSSWTADVPPLLLVVIPALLERLDGGSGWHTAAAGTLAVVAVVGGGAGRHAGPLVVGVVTVVLVVGIETLAVAAAVPTWAWLTVGGAVLLGAAALIERTGGAPIEGARRLADVLAERFD